MRLFISTVLLRAPLCGGEEFKREKSLEEGAGQPSHHILLSHKHPHEFYWHFYSLS